MAHRIKLKRFEVTFANHRYLSAYRLRIEASDAENMEDRIFLYRRGMINPYTGDRPDTFFAVASPVDMTDYPPEEPDINLAYPFFRMNFVELDFRSTELAMEAWAIIQRETCILIEALDRLEIMQLAQEVWCPGPPEEASDGSAGSSVGPAEESASSLSSSQ